MKRIILLLVVLLGAISLWASRGPTPKSSKFSWNLPNGDLVVFYHKPSDSFRGDHAKCLDLFEKNGSAHHYEFAAGHNGYTDVDLRINEDNSVIWIVDLRNNQIGGILNISEKTFTGESIPASFDRNELRNPNVMIGGINMHGRRSLKRNTK